MTDDLITAERPAAEPDTSNHPPVWSLNLQLLHRSALHSPENRAAARSAALSWLASSDAMRAATLRHPLTDSAYEGAPFEMEDGGAIAHATASRSGKLWHFMAEHADPRISKKTNQRAPLRWRLETVVVDNGDHDLLGTRLSCLTALPFIPISTPGVHKDFIACHNLRDGDSPIANAPLVVAGHESYERLLKRLLSPSRQLPLVVVSGTGDHRPGHEYLIEPDRLARTLQGLAHVVALPADFWNSLRRDIGPKLGVSHGSVRVFQPGVQRGDDYNGHWVYGRNGMDNPPDQKKFGNSLYHRLRIAALKTPEFLDSWPQMQSFAGTPAAPAGVLRGLKRLFSRTRRG